MEWYDSLVKPSWTPAPATTSLIWTLLHPFIPVSFGFGFVQAFRRKLPRRVALPFAVNLVANALLMPIFAGLRSVPLASGHRGGVDGLYSRRILVCHKSSLRNSAPRRRMRASPLVIRESNDASHIFVPCGCGRSACA